MTQSLTSYNQEMVDGVYFEIDERRCTHNELKLVNTSSIICISERPILKIDDFETVSDILVNEEANVRAFSIMLSEQGRKKLTAISKIYFGKNLALVVNDEVFCLMKINGVIRSGKIIISEDTSFSSIKFVHKRISRILDL